MDKDSEYEFQKNLIYRNTDKQKIARDFLDRYTGSLIEDFNPYIILTNFAQYLNVFESSYGGKRFTGSVMSVIHSAEHRVSMIDFKIGAPTAALITECLSILDPQAVLFLGMCGGLHRSLRVGDFILPVAAIRDEGVSRHFIPPQVPSLPTLKIQKFGHSRAFSGLPHRGCAYNRLPFLGIRPGFQKAAV